MRFGKLVLDRPLLALRANEGCKYVIARQSETREPWFVSIDPDGSMAGAPVDGLHIGASTAPFDIWVAAGRLPEDARRVEVHLDGERYDAKVRAGLWLLGVPWGNRNREGTVRFVGPEDEAVATEPLDLLR